jgi:hypothetical protein
MDSRTTMRLLPPPIHWPALAALVKAEWVLWAATAGLAEVAESTLEDFVSVVAYDYNLQRKVTAIQT